MFRKDRVAFYASFFLLLPKLALLLPVLAQVDFFRQLPRADASGLSYGSLERPKAKVLFFISSGCRSCAREASEIENELKSLGVDYEMEGVFLGGPRQVGQYLSSLGGYPFNFELGLDADGSLARRYGVGSFPSAVIQWRGKALLVNRAEEIREKLK